jgi:hypothetical protein
MEIEFHAKLVTFSNKEITTMITKIKMNKTIFLALAFAN